MKALKYSLVFFFVVDMTIVLVSQLAPRALSWMFPQYDARWVGALFLVLGCARLYGGLRIPDRRAFQVSILSWIVELVYNGIAMVRMPLFPNVVGTVVCIFMFAWSIVIFRQSYPGR